MSLMSLVKGPRFPVAYWPNLPMSFLMNSIYNSNVLPQGVGRESGHGVLENGRGLWPDVEQVGSIRT